MAKKSQSSSSRCTSPTALQVSGSLVLKASPAGSSRTGSRRLPSKEGAPTGRASYVERPGAKTSRPSYKDAAPHMPTARRAEDVPPRKSLVRAVNTVATERRAPETAEAAASERAQREDDGRWELRRLPYIKSVNAAGLEQVAQLCSAAFEAEKPELCREAVGLFGLALAKASPAAIRSPSAASACAMAVSVLRHPQEECRKAAQTEAQKHLDAVLLLRTSSQGIGGKDCVRRWQAATSLLQAARMLMASPTTLERVRANDGLKLIVEAWKTGGHVHEVSQECSALVLQLAPHHARAVAASGAGECAVMCWQRSCAYESGLRGGLVQGFAEVAMLCLPHIAEKPQILPKLACDSLRGLMTTGPVAVIASLLKALMKMTDAKTAPELSALGVPELALKVISDDRLGCESLVRRLAAEAFVKPVSLVAAAEHTASKQVQHASPSSSSSSEHGYFLVKQTALPSAQVAWEAEQASRREPQPTKSPAICAAALRRRLECWRNRVTAVCRSKCGVGGAALDLGHDDENWPPLLFDSNFECGSLGPVTRLAPCEYELQLLADKGQGGDAYVQWFCFRVKQMRPGLPYTFHLANLVKAGSLFDDGCQPVLFSKKRMAPFGIGWSREGIDVAYYPTGSGTGSDKRKYHTVSFEISFPFDEDECFLAHAVPYTWSDLLTDLARWPEVPRESLTVTPGLYDVHALRLGNPLAKQRVCIVARAHPGETHASWVMRGVLEFLLGGSPEAKAILEELAWLVVPMLNPDGVASGRTRTNLDCIDLNRHHHDDSTVEGRSLKLALQEEAERGELLAFVDIHGHSRRRGIFAICEKSSAECERLIGLLAARTPLVDAPGTSWTDSRPQDAGVGRVAAASHGYKCSMTLESSLCARHSAAGGEHLTLKDLVSVGCALCQAIGDLTKPPTVGLAAALAEEAPEAAASPEAAAAAAASPEEAAAAAAAAAPLAAPEDCPGNVLSSPTALAEGDAEEAKAPADDE
eukprot:TRINITY_DN10552_c1_g1_i1.p1 TRINITY_DN10552_c1_g1~~TRINITY_DN10552_c1_g1_i1.p1  ORF type:complete len:985 (-),score=219.10 TRINITY_DN10552_c1_g1_i1:216-3170(-)